MAKLLTGRRRQARELRDACLMLVARHGLASRQGGAPATEVELDPFRIRLTPSGARREMDVWHAGTGGGAKVLSLWWSGEDFTVAGFRRGAWEQELLALDGRGASPPCSLPCRGLCRAPLKLSPSYSGRAAGQPGTAVSWGSAHPGPRTGR